MDARIAKFDTNHDGHLDPDGAIEMIEDFLQNDLGIHPNAPPAGAGTENSPKQPSVVAIAAFGRNRDGKEEAAEDEGRGRRRGRELQEAEPAWSACLAISLSSSSSSVLRPRLFPRDRIPPFDHRIARIAEPRNGPIPSQAPPRIMAYLSLTSKRTIATMVCTIQKGMSAP